MGRRAFVASLMATLCVVGVVADERKNVELIPGRPLRTGRDLDLAGSSAQPQPRHQAGIAGPSVNEPATDRRRVEGGGDHSNEFLAWARRFSKLGEYCGGAPLPCDESLYRERVWRRNQAAINEHNTKPGTLMRKGLTRFADLTVEEFSRHHATYSAPLVKEESDGVSKGLAVRQLSNGDGEKGAASDVEAPAGERKGENGAVSLKEATDAAAAAGERLPSEGSFGGSIEGVVGRVFPSLGASGAFTPGQRRAAKRRASRQRLREGINQGGPLGTGLPKYHNWADKIDFGAIIHQGSCAGCWAYSTASVVQAAQFITSGEAKPLSPYSLIDCDNLDHGCMTGNMASAYAWIQTSKHGIPPLTDYPDRRGSCDRASLGMSVGAKTKGYCDLPVLSRDAERQMLEALWQQPVAVGVNIHALQFYASGIVKIEDCPPADENPLRAINHAAVLTGWGYDDATDQYYWILRNTYGDHWGESGYARLAFGQDKNNFGTCALYTEGNFPLLGNLSCTPSSVRKEAVKHGKHVWLYPGGYNMGPHDASGLNLNSAAAILGENMQSAALIVVCGLLAVSVVVMAAQASALSRRRRELASGGEHVGDLARSISGARRVAVAEGGEDVERGEENDLRVSLLTQGGARYGTSGSPLEYD